MARSSLAEGTGRHRGVLRLLRGDDPTLRALIVVAHPADETLGAGALLQGAAQCTIVHVTDSAAGRAELARALAVAGGRAKALQSIGVPEADCVDHIPFIARALALTISAVRPHVLLTHPYEGGHPDHDAVACAVQAALALLVRDGAEAPHLLEMADHHGADGAPTYGRFVAQAGRVEYAVVLGNDVRERKTEMLDSFVSQHAALSPFPRDIERYREGGPYDFGLPPHDGELHYERMGWAVGAAWRERARQAAAALALESSLCPTPAGPS